MPNKFIQHATEFYNRMQAKLNTLAIDTQDMTISHLAFRTNSISDYITLRNYLETYAAANAENFWNGRPISKLLLKQPIRFADGKDVELIELIPPPHQRVYPMGFEHLGLVVNADFAKFQARYNTAFTGQQFQSEECRPLYIRFDDYSHVKFYTKSLRAFCEGEGRSFNRFEHEPETIFATLDTLHQSLFNYNDIGDYHG